MKTKNLINYAKITALSLGIFVSSCSSEAVNELPEDNQTQFTKKFFQGEHVDVEKLNDGTYRLDGSDIILFPEQLSDSPADFNQNLKPDGGIHQKLGLAGGIRKWTNNTVVYVINNLSQSVRSELQKSMDEWSSKTNIKFKERTNESNYVTISSNGNACNCGSANLGMNGSRGRINLGTRSTAVVIIHEIGHTLGYVHEQTRSDRDNHVIVHFDNIAQGRESQFRKNTRAELVTKAFDIKSTMMYGSYTFSKNRKPTITDLNGNTYPRRKAELSALDIQGTNKVYPKDTDSNTNDKCNGVETYSNQKQYQVGDKVIYKGILYEKDFSGWNRIQECDSVDTTEEDICKDVRPYNRSNQYASGDKVTYNGYLYLLNENRSWSNLGKCNN